MEEEKPRMGREEFGLKIAEALKEGLDFAVHAEKSSALVSSDDFLKADNRSIIQLQQIFPVGIVVESPRLGYGDNRFMLSVILE